MIFSSYEFIFIFLPILLVTYAITKSKPSGRPLAVLVVGSLIYYGYWNYKYLVLIIASALFNYAVGKQVEKKPNTKIMAIGVTINLLVLAYFKYSIFILNTVSNFVSLNFVLPVIVLPLGISFFTFQQIAYLVDIGNGKKSEQSFLNYLLFVTYFPQLIAGPIVHYTQVSNQFRNLTVSRMSETFPAGISLFSLGLFKKCVIADNVAFFSDAIHGFAETVGVSSLTVPEVWVGIFAYTFQIYFDFSGYSDMALGLAYMVGIHLPVNFMSPYKSRNIVEFWRRWHITLSTFLRDYLYIPLGGNRQGSFNRYRNIIITMLLGGLWHGAGWNFIIWGGLHGMFLIANHLIINYRSRLIAIPQVVSIGTTFVLVAITWLFFRADNSDIALSLLSQAFNIHAITIPSMLSEWLPQLDTGMFPNFDQKFRSAYFWLPFCAAVVWIFPNSMQIFNKIPIFNKSDSTDFYSFYTWRPSALWALAAGVMFAIAISSLTSSSRFIYYQF